MIIGGTRLTAPIKGALTLCLDAKEMVKREIREKRDRREIE
jgi:hypothetical protein